MKIKDPRIFRTVTGIAWVGTVTYEQVDRIRAAAQPDVASTTQSRRALGDGPPVLRKAKLQVLSGAFAGRELELTKALTTLGRPGVQVAAITRRWASSQPSTIVPTRKASSTCGA